MAGNKVLERLEERKKAKAAGKDKGADTKLSVVKDEGETSEEQEKSDPGINPPEGADQGEPPPDEDKPAKNSTTGRTRKKRPEKTTKASSDESPQMGVLMRALEAAWEVLAEDIAERVKNRK